MEEADQDNPRNYEIIGPAEEGWFKIVRAFFEHPLWVDCPVAWVRVWLVILGHANWAPRKRWFNRREIEVQPGELLCSLDWLCKKARVTKMQTRSALEYLKRTESIALEITHRGTLLTITNWKRYRPPVVQSEHTEQHTKQHSDNTVVTQSQHSRNTTRRIKEVEEVEETPKTNISPATDETAVADVIHLSDIPPLPIDESGFPIPPKITSPWTPEQQVRALAQIGWSGVKNLTDAQEDWLSHLNHKALTSLPDDPKSLYSIHLRLLCFNSFWSIYPKREGKRVARYAFFKQCHTPDEAEEVVEFLADGAAEAMIAERPNPRYRKDPSTWLNARPWEKKKEPEEPAPAEAPLFANEHHA